MANVSVIIPTYGIPLYLEKAISSVLNQTYHNLELIIVDDNDPNTDARKRTEEIVERFTDSRIVYLKHEHNMNGSAARNTGLSKANGIYVAFLDSDDEYMSTRVEKCVDVLESVDASVAGVYTGCEFRRCGKKYNSFSDVESGNFIVETLACTFMFCTGSNIFMKKSVIDEMKGFDTSFIRHQDYEFLVRVFEKYSLVALNEILVIKNNENVNLPNVEKMIEVKKMYLKKYKEIVEQLSQNENQYIYYSQYIQIAEAAYISKKYDIGNMYLRLAKKSKKISLNQYARFAFLIIKSIFR